MPWSTKEQPHFLDEQPVPGLYFLIGDLFAKDYQQNHLHGQKYPLLNFPSELEREVREDRWTGEPLITIFKEVNLSLWNSRDDAYLQVKRIVEAEGYRLVRIGKNLLEIWDFYTGGRYRLSFDPVAQQLIDVSYVAREAAPSRAPRPMELLDARSRALLPELYSTEPFGLDAIAL